MSAVLSACRRYRFELRREVLLDAPPKTWGAGAAVFVMLNPSTADENLDDPTIRRCLGFARTWSCDRLVVANLYAYRATKPSDLWRAEDPVGLGNNDHLINLAMHHREIICAWGSNAGPGRVFEVASLLRLAGARLWCLGTTKDGAPRHPLYVRGDQPREPWPRYPDVERLI